MVDSSSSNTNPSRVINREVDDFVYKKDYRINNLVYPTGLEIESASFMTFYINVDERGASARKASDVSGAVTSRGQNRIVKDFDGTSVKKGLSTITEDNPENAKVTKYLKDFTKSTYKDIESLTGFGRPLKRLSTAITLPMPVNLSAQYSMQYTEDTFGPVDNALFSSPQTMSANRSFGDTFKTALARGAGVLVARQFDSQLSKNVNSNLTGIIGKATGQIFNNRREVTFVGVNPRSFVFEFQFSPKNTEECDTVRQIIQTFKYHAHPELADNNVFYIVPSEFDIAFYFNGKENTYINRISSCVLPSISILYTPGSSWATLSNGHPSQITITLQFTELETITKERIKPASGEFSNNDSANVSTWKGGY
jgi:hypothetical protein